VVDTTGTQVGTETTSVGVNCRIITDRKPLHPQFVSPSTTAASSQISSQGVEGSDPLYQPTQSDENNYEAERFAIYILI